jgi:hypothetical protein
MSKTQRSLQETNKAQTPKQTETDNTDNEISLTELKEQINRKHRINFLGLEHHTQTEYPDNITAGAPAHDETPTSFNEAVKLLPDAAAGRLRSVNRFVNEDGTIDIDAVKNEDGVNVDDLPVNPEEITDADQTQEVTQYKDIVDTRREALNALGCDCKYRWQIATSSYAIINPQDAYQPAYKTFKEEGLGEDIFGWIDVRDWGGYINMYILFKNHTLEHPDEDTDDEIYIGLKTGYDFSSSRAMDVELFGYDAANDVRLYSLGERRTRRHVGDPNNPEHERDQGRTPIKEWWSKEHENLITWTDDLVTDVEQATATTVTFGDVFPDEEYDMTIEDFYSYLDLPESYIHGSEQDKTKLGAVERARNHSPSSDTYTMWTLFYALSTTLEKEFQGQDRAGSAYKIYADIATNILRSPAETIQSVRREFKADKQKENNTNKRKNQVITTDDGQETIESVDDIEGVSTEDQLDLIEKRNIADNKQQEIFDFDQ